MDSSSYNAVAPPPPPSIGGVIPPVRIQTQNTFEAPACVQNAMMTKDKKPFTYTPGGIDLSQIRSPRMARRINRNANSEGVPTQPKMSPLAENNNASPHTASMSNSALPVQVFPTGPPPPPPPPKVDQQPQNKSVSNGGNQKKPIQSFEPPPMGCRPEIKIPPNPMANLRPTPKPQTKDDFWVEEYRKEKSKSPNPPDLPKQGQIEVEQQNIYKPSPVETSPQYQQSKPQTYTNNSSPVNNYNDNNIGRNNQFNTTGQLSPNNQINDNYNRSTDNSPGIRDGNIRIIGSGGQQSPHSPINDSYRSNDNSPRIRDGSVKLIGSGPQSPHSPMNDNYRSNDNSPVIRDENILNKNRNNTVHSPPMKHQPNPICPVRESPRPIQLEQQRTQPIFDYHQPVQPTATIALTEPVTRNNKPPVLYIPPASFANEEANKAQLLNQQTPPWMAKKFNDKEIPEWANKADSLNNVPGQKERIIPIQIEKTPSPQTCHSSIDFRPQQNLFTNNRADGKNQWAPEFTSATPQYDLNPNKFVDQGYNNFQNEQQKLNHPQWANNQGSIRPQDSNIINNNVTYSNSGHVTTPREAVPKPQTIQHQIHQTQNDNSWGNNGNGTQPNQSKSFRVLQKITDTMKSDSIDDNQPIEYQQPRYSKTIDQQNINDNKLKRLQLNENDRALMNRLKTQVDQESFLHSEEDPRYRGAAIPSKAFKILQNMTDMGSPPDPVNATPRREAKRFSQHKAMFENDGNDQKFIPASEREVFEPKTYQGSSTPGRSFKILQAMTTPENAAENWSDSTDDEHANCYQISNSQDLSLTTMPNPNQYDPDIPTYQNNFPATNISDAADFKEVTAGLKNVIYVPEIVVTPITEQILSDENDSDESESLVDEHDLKPSPDEYLLNSSNEQSFQSTSGNESESSDSESSESSSEEQSDNKPEPINDIHGIQSMKSVSWFSIHQNHIDEEEEKSDEESDKESENESEEESDKESDKENEIETLSIINEEPENVSIKDEYEDLQFLSNHQNNRIDTIEEESESSDGDETNIEENDTFNIPTKLNESPQFLSSPVILGGAKKEYVRWDTDSNSKESDSDESNPFKFNITKFQETDPPNEITLNSNPIISVRAKIQEIENLRIAASQKIKEPPPIKLLTTNYQPQRYLPKKTDPHNCSNSFDESEVEEDSGVTSDISKQVSGTDTESEFPELRKLTRYQRAATHSRLFKLLQDESVDQDAEEKKPTRKLIDNRKKKIVHNVSITRRTNPDAIKDAETMSERRKRLSLNLNKGPSIDAENQSTSASPSSPTHSTSINESLVKELVESLLQKEKSKIFKKLPLEKLHAAAKKVLLEEMDCLDDTCLSSSIASTPALTPQEFKNGEYDNLYSDYYDSWNHSNNHIINNNNTTEHSKYNDNFHDQYGYFTSPIRKIRCPRLLSSKTINTDLCKVSETAEPQSPETYIYPKTYFK